MRGRAGRDRRRQRVIERLEKAVEKLGLQHQANPKWEQIRKDLAEKEYTLNKTRANLNRRAT